MPNLDDYLVSVLILVAILIGILWYRTYRTIYRSHNSKYLTKEEGRGNVLRETIEHDGRLYTVIRRNYEETKRTQLKEEANELTTVTESLMWWTALLASSTLIATVFAVFTLFAIRGQLTEMQTVSGIEQKTLVMSERPWLFIKGDIESLGISSGPDKTTSSFATDVIDDGNAIAVDAEINGSFVLEPTLGGGVDYKTIPCNPRLDMWEAREKPPKAAIAPKHSQRLRFYIKYVGDIFNLLQMRSIPRMLECIQYKWPFTDETFHTYFSVGVGLVDVNTGETARSYGALRVNPRGEISYIRAD